MLCVTNMYPTDGCPVAGVFVERQVSALRSLGHDVDVAVVEGRRSRTAYVRAIGAIAARSRRERYDLVHAHYGLTGCSALLAGAPLVVTLHGSDALVGSLQPFLSRIACRKARAIVAVSERIAERVRGLRRGGFGPHVPVHVIPCGVDLDRFGSVGHDDARARLGLSPERRHVLFPFDPTRKVKRADLARAVIERVNHSRRDVALHVTSNVPHDEMPLHYAAADVMLLTSDSEGSPTSVKESLACNTPVVSVDVGGVREILDGVPGTHVCPRDVDALARAVLDVLTRSEPFDGRSFALRYDERTVAGRLANVYGQVARA